ncbi:MAG: cupin domain-containing protein [Proteobacteria bacterium]|nr:cupin domain-containing protein [Pseudomonadota bacterium]
MAQPYSVKAVTVLAKGADMLVREFVFAPGEGTPWHRHGAVRDLCCCVLGEIVLETRAPDSQVVLGPGERAETPAGQVHRLVNRGPQDCRLILIQAGGAYDFQTEV